jgi:hypothetical protein
MKKSRSNDRLFFIARQQDLFGEQFDPERRAFVGCAFYPKGGAVGLDYSAA